MIGAVRLEEITTYISGIYRGANVPFQSVSIDTRTLQPGDLFIALVGDRFDGHEYIEKAIERGASAIVISKKVECSVPYILVENTEIALAKIAKFNREKFKKTIIAVTGSSGKTTVKEMIAAILRQRSEVLATSGNLNNHIGAPLTLLRLNQHHDAGVIELGASAQGEIAYTAALAQPYVSIITNADAAHLEGFGSIDTVAKTKGEIIEHLVDGGVAILNADSEYFDQWVQLADQKKIISFGFSEESDVRATDITPDEQGRCSFNLLYGDKKLTMQLQVMGMHNVKNALAACAACLAINLDIDFIANGLQDFSGVKGRLVEVEGLNSSRIIDDSYNANPASVRAAIDVLATRSGTKILVLGDMAELGAETQRAHAEIGIYANRAGINAIYALGEFSRSAVDAFGVNGHWFASHDTMVRYLKRNLVSDVTALIKGSRSARMDRIVTEVITDIKVIDKTDKTAGL